MSSKGGLTNANEIIYNKTKRKREREREKGERESKIKTKLSKKRLCMYVRVGGQWDKIKLGTENII